MWGALLLGTRHAYVSDVFRVTKTRLDVRFCFSRILCTLSRSNKTEQNDTFGVLFVEGKAECELAMYTTALRSHHLSNEAREERILVLVIPFSD